MAGTRMADKKEETQTLYHHTTRDGAKAILQSGYIKESTDTKSDARYGPGTYLTSYGPDKSKHEVAKNNYDGINNRFANQMVEAGKTDVTIAVDMPKSQVTKAKSDRDIFVAKGDVTLADKNPRVFVRDQDGKSVEFKQDQ